MGDDITSLNEVGQDRIMVLVEQEERVAGVLSYGAGGCRLRRAFADTTPAALSRICDNGMALAIWERKLCPDLLVELEQLEPDGLDDILLTASLDEVEPVLANTMHEAGYGDVPQLRRDIADLARQHAAIAGTSAIRIRLEIVDTDACRKFHADHVTVRTISTYRGQGTQWVEAGRAVEGMPINQLETGWVGMFKGRDWQQDPAILHRSPPLGSSGEQRLVLVIDPAPANEEDATRPGKARQ